MLDRDLAKLYETETRIINQSVKRNKERFPEEFCFQFVILKERGYNIKYLPYAFTEQGVAMLSAILKSKTAIIVSIDIMNAFVSMRKYISTNLIEQKFINSMVLKHDERLTLLENAFSKFDTFSNELFFDGQIYDAYSLLLDIFSSSKQSILIIDNYISKELLDIVCKTNNKVTIYTKNIDNILINKYQSQYNNLTININNSFHDRFIIIDNLTLYHCGASFKDLGKKCFAINKINNKEWVKELLSKL